MANLREHLNRVADRIRALPGRLGERPTTVTIVTREWSGSRVAQGTVLSETSLTITPTPKVRTVSSREIAASGGRYQAEDVRVGPITPTYDTGVSSGGYASSQVAPVKQRNGIEVVYRLAGWLAGDYERVDTESDRTHQITIVLRRKRSTP